jgi:hypothetical protein
MLNVCQPPTHMVTATKRGEDCVGAVGILGLVEEIRAKLNAVARSKSKYNCNELRHPSVMLSH